MSSPGRFVRSWRPAVAALAVASLPALLAGAPAASAAPPSLAALPARALLLIDRDTGAVLYSRAAATPLAIASTTKLMTAYVTLHREPLGRVLVEQPYAARRGESIAGVPAGTRLTTARMLRAMLLPSGNDVATSLAIDVAGSVPRFVALMNAAARRLGLTDTHFTTPVGLDVPGNHASADDLARLTEVLLRDRFFAAVVREQSAQITPTLVVRNTDDLLASDSAVVGVKTGYTVGAGYCLVTAAVRHGVHLLSVVLGAPTHGARDADALALIRYGFATLRFTVAIRAGGRYAAPAVSGRGATRAPLVATRGLRLVVRVGVRLRRRLVGVPATLRGPLPAGHRVGRVEVLLGGRVAGSVPLQTRRRVSAPPPDLVLIGVLALLALLGLTLAVGCSLSVMRRRARGRLRWSGR